MFVSCECGLLFRYRSLRFAQGSPTECVTDFYQVQQSASTLARSKYRGQNKKKGNMANIAPNLNVRSSAMLLLCTLNKLGRVRMVQQPYQVP
jgi:hypothetical protein